MRLFPDSQPPKESSFGEPKSGVRVLVDSLLQAALVDLFSAYGVAFAPLPRSALGAANAPEVSVAATFRNGSSTGGRLTLSLPAALLEHMKGEEATSVRLDWARELANQLLGRVKNRLLPFGVRIDIGVLTSLHPTLIQHQLQDLSGVRVYHGRTLRGPVLVTVRGLPEDSSLSYAGALGAKEGSMLWL